MTGLPLPSRAGAMLPADTLAGVRALVLGDGFVTETTRSALTALGAEVSSAPLASEGYVEDVVATSDAEILVVNATNAGRHAPTHAELTHWGDGPGSALAAAFAALVAFGATPTARGGLALVAVDPVAVHGGPGVAAAAAAQAALVSLTQSLALEWAPRDIRINALAVGRFEGNDTSGLPGNLPALRFGDARELSWIVEYLCSPYSAYLTGTTLTIDGGDGLKRYLLEPPYEPDEYLA